MRKKTFLRVVAIVACLAILSLSAPAVSAAKDGPDKVYFRTLLQKHLKLLASLFLHVNFDVDNNENPAPKQDKISKTSTDSDQPIKITGTLSSVRPPKTGDEND